MPEGNKESIANVDLNISIKIHLHLDWSALIKFLVQSIIACYSTFSIIIMLLRRKKKQQTKVKVIALHFSLTLNCL